MIRRLPKWLLMRLVRAYQLTLSPYMGRQCRFEPSCSHYAMQAIEEYGATNGAWLATKRIARCHPFNPGGYDPVMPVMPTGQATRQATATLPATLPVTLQATQKET